MSLVDQSKKKTTTSLPKYLHEWWTTPEERGDVDEQERETQTQEAGGEAEEAGQRSSSGLAVAFEWACQGRLLPHTDRKGGRHVYSVFVTLPDCSSYRGSSRAGYAQALRNAYKQFVTETKAQAR
jgi:hypothetical protein